MKQELKFFGIGILSLLLGLTVYLFARSTHGIYLFSLPKEYINLFTFSYHPFWIYNITGTLHVIGMSLISFSLSPTKRYYVYPTIWTGINVFFELLQHPVFQQYYLNHKGWIDSKIMDNFIVRSTFDTMDILFICMGGIVSYTLIKYLAKTKRPN